ncbi:hypothetical protein [Actinomadura flavalba]|uniref:hypothetical protein n=1 Tax=Actinomadura flavalba TaxID=1120938 RepID=UPI000380021B|nr:hypothetical protein [Actinomadura flavalba]
MDRPRRTGEDLVAWAVATGRFPQFRATRWRNDLRTGRTARDLIGAAYARHARR